MAIKLDKFTITRTSFGADGYSIVENVTEMTGFDGDVLSEQSFVKYSIMNPADDRIFSIPETVERLIYLTEQLVKFWGNPAGWAPIDTTEILTRSRLDWQFSLTKQLRLFVDKDNKESGYLILAWATLGSLTEGLLKLFLSIHYKTYQVHILMDEVSRIVRDRSGEVPDPDGLMFEKIRQFFEKKVFPKNAKQIWEQAGELNWLLWLGKIQGRRNAIHAFKDREIGTIGEFHFELQNYLIFTRKIAYSLPYPDEVYEPQESLDDASSTEYEVQVSDRRIRCRIEKGKIKVMSQADGEFFKKEMNLEGQIQVLNSAQIPSKWK